MMPIPYIDIHCHLGESLDGGVLHFDDLQKILNDYPSAFVVTFALNSSESVYSYTPVNNQLRETVSKDPRLIWFGRINPNHGEMALEEMERVKSLGALGIKLHPYSENFRPLEARAVFKKASQLKMPIMLHTTHWTFNEQRRDWEKLFDLTEAPIIAAHAGKDSYRELVKIVPRFPHLFVDTTTVSLYRTRYIYECIGADRIVYGSDLPYSHPAIERVKYELILSPEDRDKVYWKNSAQILGVSPPE